MGEDELKRLSEAADRERTSYANAKTAEREFCRALVNLYRTGKLRVVGEGEGWQPIETAPECWMEEREVLLLLEDGRHAVSMHRDTDGVFHAGDWEYPLPATHWMPLRTPTIEAGGQHDD